jgi:pimeloyl-ACP methyl ester carboxylesterase
VPGLVGAMFEWGLGEAARDEGNPGVFEEVILKDMASRPEADRRCLEDEEFRTRFLNSARESFRVSSQGVAWEARLFGSPWGFALTDVKYEGVTLWHGGLDVNSPIGMAKKAAEMLTGAELKELDGEGHICFVNHMEEILGHLTSNCSTE